VPTTRKPAAVSTTSSPSYPPSLVPGALLTDLYQLTMAYGLWRAGRAEHDGAFHLYFRTPPFGGGYTVACGVEAAAAYLERLRFADDDLAYVASLRGARDTPLFDAAFVDYLATLRPRLDVEMVAEGTVVFPNEPLIRVRGPLVEAQLVETTLLNLVGFATLVATKAARVCEAAAGDEVIEFGLRRAQGPDGGVTASRAAYVGGCAATSNVLAGRLFGIPVKGTHAHSWVMAFDSEREAFDAYADALPHLALFLVDTYDTVGGVRNAIEVGRRLRAAGFPLLGVRLDSGDLAYLSGEARRLLDEAGFRDATVLASNDLDEHLIESLKRQGAAIGAWGVGTRLATAADNPSLGCVYKLAAVRAPGGEWVPRVKVSEQAAKTTTPGLLQTRRFLDGDGFAGDMVFDELHPPADGDQTIVHPVDPTRRKRVAAGAPHEDLLEPVFRGGARVRPPAPLEACRARARAQVAALHPAVRRLVNPHAYPAGLELALHDRKTAMILRAKGLTD
jgi:nicotinate phosphoribosyltransferase